jgi:general secretion pathway protein A
MYEAYYGLKERPFDLSPNTRFLFLSRKHHEALAHLEYALGGRPGITVLIGEAGTGKTTLIRAALQLQPHNGFPNRVVHLANPTLTRAEFFEYLAEGFGFSPDAARSKTRFIREMEQALSRDGANGAGLAIVVDEAQSVPHELLEEIRLLSNIDTLAGRALGVVLVGQPELSTVLNDPSLRQLKQRVALRCELGPLDLPETASYISARVKVAGGRGDQLFTREAVIAIHKHSGGIPRTVSVICDNALVNGFASDVKPVGADGILEVCRDFHIETAGQPRAEAKVPAAGEAARAAIANPPVEAPASASTPEEPTGESRPSSILNGITRPRRFFQFMRYSE